MSSVNTKNEESKWFEFKISIANAKICHSIRAEHSAHRDEDGKNGDDDREDNCDCDDCPGANLDTLGVFGIEIPHKSGG